MPVWAAVTVIISILLAAGGLLFGVAQKGAMEKVEDVRVDVREHSVKIGALETDTAVIRENLQSVNRNQDKILTLLTDIGSKMGVPQ